MTGGVLVINGGSSSVKFALYSAVERPQAFLSGNVERIGLEQATFTVKGAKGESLMRQPVEAPDHEQAAACLLDWLDKRHALADLRGIGHRVVQGGQRFTQPVLITAEVVSELKRLSPLAPDHLPGEIALIEAFGRSQPNRPQVACFDTAFHHDLPRVAAVLPIPRRYEAQGVRRYGFHGISYSFLMEELARVAGPQIARGRVVLAHLGAGASMAAVHEGKCIDTSMAFTPAAGLVMGTRSGDLDPGFLLYLLREQGMSAQQMDDLVNRQSGLLGVSETSSDMRDLLARQATDPRAAEAVALFCYQAKKWIGAYAAALGGLDTLVFSGGIGENAAEVRARICAGLGFIGLSVDEAQNSAGAAVISTATSRVGVRVIRTDEEFVIAQSVCRLLL